MATDSQLERLCRKIELDLKRHGETHLRADVAKEILLILKNNPSPSLNVAVERWYREEPHHFDSDAVIEDPDPFPS